MMMALKAPERRKGTGSGDAENAIASALFTAVSGRAFSHRTLALQLEFWQTILLEKLGKYDLDHPKILIEQIFENS